MPLESATYISELVPTNPAGSDAAATSDDHHRLIKDVLQNTFPNANGAITPTPAEFNTLVGVTSGIQAQIDGKQTAHQNLTDISGLAATDGNIIVGDGSNFVAESGATARASLGIDGASGVIATGDIADLAISTAKLADTSVTQAKIASAAVGQGQLKTTIGQGSTTSAAWILKPSDYAFEYELYNSSTFSSDEAYVGIGTTSGSSSAVAYRSATQGWGKYVYLTDKGGATSYIRWRYVQASPPYDLGDGDIPIFVFALVNKATREVESVYSAVDAPWHGNGPTNIKADFYRNGKGYRLRRDMSKVPFTLEDAKSDPVKLTEYMAAFKAAPIIEEEITQAIKNADMPLIPHPFMGNDLTGKTVVMLDPVADLTWQLAEMCECHDKFNLNELLHEGHIVIDNQPLNRAGPPGLPVVSFKWKNTGAR